MEATSKALSARMDRVLADVPVSSSKSERIRRLAKAGFERADIARYIGVRYQFVHNVVSAAGITPTAGSERMPGAAPATGTDAARHEPNVGSAEAGSRWYWCSIDTGGRLGLPANFLAALRLSDGDTVQLELTDDAIVVRSRDVAMKRLRQMVSEQIPGDRDLVEELIEDRRAEARREQDDE